MAKQRQRIKFVNPLSGDKLFLKRARIVLPYLVRQAKAAQTIYYSDLASQVDIPNPRNLNYVLGAIGRAMIELSKRTNVNVPPIQCLVINKRDQLPGEGIGWFITKSDFAKLNKTQKERIVAAQLAIVFAFQYWDWVLEELELDPILTSIESELEKAKGFQGGGESEQHRKFKMFISENPKVLGLNADIGKGRTEYPLPSADKVDIMFEDKDLKIGVEVKSVISNTADILRGLFQCVKYRWLIEAEQIVRDQQPNSRVILALEGAFPKELLLARGLLGIEVVDGIKISR
jgi:hypothetical protein